MALLTLLQGGVGNDTLTGTAAADILNGDAGNDRLNGGDGADVLKPGSGTNQIDAGAGNDLIVIDGSASNGLMGVPADGIDGGAGYDSVAYAGLSTYYRMTQTVGGPLTVVNLTNCSRDLMVGVQRLVFADAEHVLVPANSAPVVSGAVVATLTEGNAASSFDALAFASDADAQDVLTVVDLPALPEGISFDAASQSFVVDPSATAFDALNAGQSVVLTIDYGVSDGTLVTAAQAVFTINGVDDLNLITGTAATDKLVGTSAADEILGLQGQDTLTGQAGDDVLDGGAGNDSILGGAGNDRVFHDAADRLADGGSCAMTRRQAFWRWTASATGWPICKSGSWATLSSAWAIWCCDRFQGSAQSPPLH